MILVPFQGKPFNITVIQVYVPRTDAEKAEVAQFYEDAQHLLKLTRKNFSSLGGWNAKVGSQEIPELTGKFGLGYRMKQGKG